MLFLNSILWGLYLQEVQQNQQAQEDQPHHGHPVSTRRMMLSYFDVQSWILIHPLSYYNDGNYYWCSSLEE